MLLCQAAEALKKLGFSHPMPPRALKGFNDDARHLTGEALQQPFDTIERLLRAGAIPLGGSDVFTAGKGTWMLPGMKP